MNVLFIMILLIGLVSIISVFFRLKVGAEQDAPTPSLTQCYVHPKRIELLSPEPESAILSIELRVHSLVCAVGRCLTLATDPQKPRSMSRETCAKLNILFGFAERMYYLFSTLLVGTRLILVLEHGQAQIVLHGQDSHQQHNQTARYGCYFGT